MNLYKDVPKEKANVAAGLSDNKNVLPESSPADRAGKTAQTIISAVSSFKDGVVTAAGNFKKAFTDPDVAEENKKVWEQQQQKKVKTGGGIMGTVNGVAVDPKLREKPDMAALEFPAFAKNINKIRAMGYSDEDIVSELALMEMEELGKKGATVESVDKYFGRTESTKRQLEMWQDAQETAGFSAVAQHLTTEQIERRKQIAKATGLSPSVLLFNDGLAEAIESNAKFKENEGYWQTISEAWKRSSLRDERSNLYIMQLNGETPEEKWAQSYSPSHIKYFKETGQMQTRDSAWQKTRIAEIDKELAELAPSPFEGSFQRTVGQAVENTADWIDWQDIVLMAASGGLSFAGTAASGLSKAQKVAKVWKAASNAYKISMVERTFKREFAEKHEELTGYGIDRDRAINVSAAYAVLSTWAEYGQLEAMGSLAKAGTGSGPVARLFGLGKRDFSRLATESPVMQQALEKTTADCAEALAKNAGAQTSQAAQAVKSSAKSAAQDMLSFTPKQVMAQGVKNILTGLVEEDLEEVVQRFYSNLANEVAAYAQGDTKYKHKTVGEILIDSAQAGIEALPSLALMVGGTGAFGMARGSLAARNFQKDNATLLARLQYEQEHKGSDAKASHLTKDTGLERAPAELAEKGNLGAAELAENGNEVNFAYINKAKMDTALEQLAAVSPEAAENFANTLMLSDDTTIKTDSMTDAQAEYVIDKNVYDEAVETLPEEAKAAMQSAVGMNLREGAAGITTAEIAEFYEAKTHDPFENKEDAEAQAAISIRAQLTGDLEAAGQSTEVSQTVADIYSRYLYVSSKMYGKTVDELHNLSVQRAGGYDASRPEDFLGKAHYMQSAPGGDYKSRQFDIIQRTNPMRDDYHTGIRSADEIKTLQETLDDTESFSYPDFTRAQAEAAIKKGWITVYSSKPIANGAFVTPSRMAAQDYTGPNGEVHSKNVPINCVAFINGDEGVYADAREEWERKLERHNESWNKRISENINFSKKDMFLMNVPVILTEVAGMEEGSILMHASKIQTIMEDHKQEIDLQSFKDLPLKMANPVMVLKSSRDSTNPNSVNLVIQVQGLNNAPVFINVSLNKKENKKGVFYYATSMYTESHEDERGKRVSSPETFDNWVQQGLLLYADETQFKDWKKQYKVTFSLKKDQSGAGFTRVQFPGSGQHSRSDSYYISTKSDLVKAREEKNNTFYQPLDLLHASKADGIKEFKLEFVGTGEGQQMFGHGIYAAMARSVVDWYIEQFSTRTVSVSYKGSQITAGNDAEFDGLNAKSAEYLNRAISNALDKTEISPTKINDLISEDIQASKEKAIYQWNRAQTEEAKARWIAYYKTVTEAENWFKENKADFEIKDEKTGAHLYRTRVPEVLKGENYLDWDSVVPQQQLKRIWDGLTEEERENLTFDPFEGDEESGLAGHRKPFDDINEFTNSGLTGKDVYEGLADALGSPPAASEFLDSIGIIGNRYLDGPSRGKGEGTYNFVIFNPANMPIIEQLFQDAKDVAEGQEEQEEHRGSITVNRTTGAKLVQLFQSADSSTFVHEMGHLILEDLMRYGQGEDATAEAKANLATALDYLGIADMDLSDPDHLSGQDRERLRAAHEKWAEAFGVYIAEGIAPSTGMRRVFKQVRKWLIDLFSEAKRSGVELSPEVRGVFDSLLATPEEQDEFYEANTDLEELLRETEAMEERLNIAKSKRGWADPLSLRYDADFAESNPIDASDFPFGANAEAGNAQGTQGDGRNADVRARIEHVNEINRKLDELDDMIALAEEERAILLEAENAPTSRKSLLKWMSDNGKKISMSQAQADFAEDAVALKNDIGGKYFSETGTGLDELAQDLENAGIEIHSGDELIAALMTHDLETPQQKREANAKIKELKSEAKQLKGELAQEEKYLKSLNPAPNKGHRTPTEALFERLHTNRVRVEDMEKIVRVINKCVTDSEVIWSVQEEILQTVLDASKVVFRKSRRKPFESVFGTKRLERAASLFEQIKADTGITFDALNVEDPQAAGYVEFLMRLEEKGYDVKDLKLSQMKLAELTALAERVTQLRAMGKAEYKLWKARREMRVSNTFQQLEMSLRNRGMTERRTVIKGKEDLGKDYSGALGKLRRARDWAYSTTLGANRFFDWLGGGGGKYDTVFTRVFVDGVNAAKNEELKWTHARRAAMEAKRKELGIKLAELGNVVIVGDERYTVDQLMSVYAGMKNDKSAAALRYGTFGALGSDADAHIASCIAALDGRYKALADFVIEEYEQHFNRLNQQFIKSFNKGMQHEANYTPMRRLEYSTSEGVIDALDKAFMQGERFGQYGAAQSLEQNAGFMKSRLLPGSELAKEYQTGIELGLVSIWNSQVQAQEHTAAFADTAPMLQQIVRRSVETPYGVKISLKKLVADNYGKEAWRTLTDYVNLITQDDITVASSCLNAFGNFAARNMAVTYLAANLGTALKQFTSIPRFLITASPARVMCAVGEAVRNWKQFSGEIYEMDPQMEDRVANPYVKIARDRAAAGRIGKLNEGAKNIMDALLGHISFCDRFVACVGWRATFDACMARGMSRQDAAREAARSVALTQQTPEMKDMPRIWQQKGILGLAMIFTSDCAQTLGMTVYDLAQNIRQGNITESMRVFAGLFVSAVLFKAACDGTPDDDEEESWAAWLADAFAQQTVESIPLVGKEIYGAVDRIYRKGYRQENTSPFIAPVEKIIKGAKKMAADDAWRDQRNGLTKWQNGAFEVAEGCALAGLPVPAVSGRRIAKSWHYIADDEYTNALKTIIGMRVRQ